MKSSLTVECDFYEERDTLKMMIYALDYVSMIHEARDVIRSRLKWGEGVSDEECKTLEELRQILYHESLE